MTSRKKADSETLEGSNGLDNVNTPDDNGADSIIELIRPIRVYAKIKGTADLLMHKWNAEYVDAKAAANKNSAEKKIDDPEKFISRNDKGEVCIPSEYVRMSIIHASKSLPDPRSPRKSMMDLMKASFIMQDKLLSFKVKKWDYLDRRRVVIQRSGINRTRPAMLAGWELEFYATIIQSQYVPVGTFRKLLWMSGQFVGLADFRPSFGRFDVIHFEEIKDKKE
jgi:hypothetical protein